MNNPQVNDKIWLYLRRRYHEGAHTAILKGGRRSGKTWHLEKAAAEKAAAEKAAAEKAAATRWTLSDRERAIIAKLSKNDSNGN